MSALPISIVGAGISGLVLGRCLLHRGIQAVIFEKSRHSTHKNNHAITLHAHSYRPLLQILNLDEPAFKQRVAVDAGVGGEGRLSSSTAESSSGISFRANRARFEQLLGEGLDIKWEHEVDSVSLASSAESPVRLQLKNGETHPSSVVVGADGPHSLVRDSISKETTDSMALKVLPFATYNGRRDLTPREFDDGFAAAMHGTNVLEQRVADAFLQISVSDRTSEKVTLSYTYSRPARNGVDPLYRPRRSKTAAKEIPEELFSELGRLQDELQGPFRIVFGGDAMRNDRLLNWLMRSAPQPLRLEQWAEAARGGIVLLGDAWHAEPILGGHGANLAIEDGISLAECLAKQGGRNLLEFYESRSKEWGKSAQESERRLVELHSQ